MPRGRKRWIDAFVHEVLQGRRRRMTMYLNRKRQQWQQKGITAEDERRGGEEEGRAKQTRKEERVQTLKGKVRQGHQEMR